MEQTTGMKKIYIDIMVDGYFWNQIPYMYLPILPIDENDAKAQVLKAYPSLANKNYTIEFSEQRIGRR